MAGKVLKIGGALAIAYALVVVLLWWKQERFLYFPPPWTEQTPASVGLQFEEVWLAAGDGTRVHAWYVPGSARGSGTQTVLFLHGNGDNLSMMVPLYPSLHHLGVSALYLDYRGYGLSDGRPDERGTYEDAQAAWDYLADVRGVAPQNIVVWGYSLGGGVASWLATRVRPGGLVLASTFTRASDRASEVFWWLPTTYLMRNRYPTIDRLSAIECPVIVAHNLDDHVVPYAHGRKLLSAARDPARFVELEYPHESGLMNQSLLDALISLGGSDG